MDSPAGFIALTAIAVAAMIRLLEALERARSRRPRVSSAAGKSRGATRAAT